MITPARAYEIASQWGSYISAGDPGVPFVSFYSADGTPVSPAHQEVCILYTINLLARGVPDADRSDLIALLVFFDNATPHPCSEGDDPWSN